LTVLPSVPAPFRLPVGRTILVLLVLLAGALILGTTIGAEPTPLAGVLRAIGHRIVPDLVLPPVNVLAEDVDGAILSDIVWSFRVPRVLLAALVGASLAIAGVALQGLLGNPLADPYFVGVSSGAAVGAGTAFLLGIAGLLGGLMLPLCAFAAALATTALVFALARVGGQLHTASFLLAGIVAGSFLWALTTLLLSLRQDTQGQILEWLMGRFSDADWSKVGLLAPFTLLSVVVFAWCGRGLDAFSFGEDTARSVGVDVERFKAGVLSLAALVTAAAVSVSGIIGFVGLVVPHLGRRLVGPPHRALVPVAALLGAILAVLADLLARTVLGEGQELPVGVVLALLGAPFFAYLLRCQMGRGG
jgi:iron complex transport system permease protein